VSVAVNLREESQIGGGEAAPATAPEAEAHRRRHGENRWVETRSAFGLKLLMIISASSVGVASGGVPANVRCPSCGQLGTFEPLGQDLLVENGVRIGERRCPNVCCRALIFAVWQNDRIIRSYPPLRIDFDKTNIPTAIISAIEEAITCHANECFIASAIMVRKTLEELCRERGAQGNDLKERVRDLGTRIVLPRELMDGLDDLRLLGNDAAHIESCEYDKVGKDEVEVGIEFAKEVLKAAYQYSTFLSRLRSLRKNP